MVDYEDDFFKDPFEDMIRGFFGQTRSKTKRNGSSFITGEGEERTIDFIEEKDYVYLIFELPGYNLEDIDVGVKGNELEISAVKSGKSSEEVQDYLKNKFFKGTFIQKSLPKIINPKGFSTKMNNGILELTFSKR